MIATDRNALTSALDENRSNKMNQSRLNPCVDRLLTYQFFLGKDMGIIDYFSTELNEELWPESELDFKNRCDNKKIF